MKTIYAKKLKEAVNLLNELLIDNQDKKEKINEVIEKLGNFDSEIFESLLKFKNLKRKLLSQIELIENNSEMYSFLSKKARLFIVKDFKDRFECDFIDERVTLSEPENEIVDEIMKTFNEEKQKLELIKNISLEELKTKLNIQYKEKDDYIDILKDDLIYSVFTKKENENNSFYCYPANQEYIFNLIPSCLPNEKFKFFILTDLIRLIPIIISEESIKVKNQLEKTNS